MLNIDRVREMDSKELTQLVNNRCQMCVYQNQSCLHDRCSEGIIQWLNQDFELTIKEIEQEFNKFCSESNCIQCSSSDYSSCHYNFLVDHFNIIDGKITRIQK